MDLIKLYSEIKDFLSIPDEEFDLEEVMNTEFESEDVKAAILGKVLAFIYNFTMFKSVRPFMKSVYSCIKNTLGIKIADLDKDLGDYDDLLIKNALVRFVQEYLEYSKISQKDQVLNFLADSFERLGVQPLMINLGLLLKPMYSDQNYIDSVKILEEVEVVVSDDEIAHAIKISMNNWLETQSIKLDEQEILHDQLKIHYEDLVDEHKLSRSSKTYNVLGIEVKEMLNLRLTMLSLMDTLPDEESFEPVPIK